MGAAAAGRRQALLEKLRETARQFGSGLRTAWLVQRRAGLFGSTVLLWVLYAAMAYVPLLLLGLVEPFGFSFKDSWGLMAAGAFGMALPAPGGTGSFHYATVQAMDLLFDVPETPAATYAVITHGVQVVFYAIGGLLAVAVGRHGVAGEAGDRRGKVGSVGAVMSGRHTRGALRSLALTAVLTGALSGCSGCARTGPSPTRRRRCCPSARSTRWAAAPTRARCPSAAW